MAAAAISAICAHMKIDRIDDDGVDACG